MKNMNWSHLLMTTDSLSGMASEELAAVSRASSNYKHTLAHGISGIGNLLACAASNEETGLNREAVANVGWMLESLGSLISNLSDTVDHADYVLNQRAQSIPSNRKR